MCINVAYQKACLHELMSLFNEIYASISEYGWKYLGSILVANMICIFCFPVCHFEFECEIYCLGEDRAYDSSCQDCLRYIWSDF